MNIDHLAGLKDLIAKKSVKSEVHEFLRSKRDFVTDQLKEEIDLILSTEDKEFEVPKNPSLRLIFLARFLSPAPQNVLMTRVRTLASKRHALKKKYKTDEYSKLFGGASKDKDIPVAITDIEHCCILVEVVATLQSQHAENIKPQEIDDLMVMRLLYTLLQSDEIERLVLLYHYHENLQLSKYMLQYFCELQ